MRRLDQVRRFRLASKRPDTVKLAKSPAEFAFVSHVDKNYLIIPSASSERRRYIRSVSCHRPLLQVICASSFRVRAPFISASSVLPCTWPGFDRFAAA